MYLCILFQNSFDISLSLCKFYCTYKEVTPDNEVRDEIYYLRGLFLNHCLHLYTYEENTLDNEV